VFFEQKNNFFADLRHEKPLHKIAILRTRAISTSNALECKLFNSQESVNNTQLELLDKYNIYFNIIRL